MVSTDNSKHDRVTQRVKSVLQARITRRAETNQRGSILAALTIASFLPQINRTIFRQDCLGISPTYIFFNLLVATDQLGFQAYLMVANSEVLDEIVASPPTRGDWLNSIQFGVVWLMNLCL